MAAPTKRLEPGIYEITTLSNQKFLIIDSRRHDVAEPHRLLPWCVCDSRGRTVSHHPSLQAAKSDTWRSNLGEQSA